MLDRFSYNHIMMDAGAKKYNDLQSFLSKVSTLKTLTSHQRAMVWDSPLHKPSVIGAASRQPLWLKSIRATLSILASSSCLLRAPSPTAPPAANTVTAVARIDTVTHQVADALFFESYTDEEVIISQGEPAETFHIIRQGEVP